MADEYELIDLENVIRIADFKQHDLIPNVSV